MIGIKDFMKPDYGDAVEMRDDELPVLRVCGVALQSVIATMSRNFASRIVTAACWRWTGAISSLRFCSHCEKGTAPVLTASEHDAWCSADVPTDGKRRSTGSDCTSPDYRPARSADILRSSDTHSSTAYHRRPSPPPRTMEPRSSLLPLAESQRLRKQGRQPRKPCGSSLTSLVGAVITPNCRSEFPEGRRHSIDQEASPTNIVQISRGISCSPRPTTIARQKVMSAFNEQISGGVCCRLPIALVTFR